MLLIRGIYSEEYARQIEQGIVSCRDIPSILLDGIGETGYLNSNYHEWLFRQSLFGIQGRIPGLRSFPSIWQRLIRVALDPLLTGSYLTYFHIFDPEITEKWLDECWGDDAYFIFYEPYFELEKYECICGNCYCGTPITYVNTPEEISPRKTMINNPALLALLKDDIDQCIDRELTAKYVYDCFLLLTPLFSRIREKKFDDRENEFRIYVRDPRKLTNNGVQFRERHELQLKCNNKTYQLRDLEKMLETPTVLYDELGNPKDFFELAWTTNKPAITSRFKSLSITDTARNYGYIGNKEDCRKFIKDFSKSMHITPSYIGNEGTFIQNPPSPKLRKVILSADSVKANLNESTIILRLPDEGCFSQYGPGFKESNFPNPIELGLFTPQASFTSAIKFLIGTEKPEDTFAFPREYSREFLHSSLDPWLPVVAMKQIPYYSLGDEIQRLKKGQIELKRPKGTPEFETLFNLETIYERLDKNITPKNMRNYFKKTISHPNLPVSAEFYKSIEAKTMDNFTNVKRKGISDILDYLPEGYSYLMNTLRCATFDFYDKGIAKDYLANTNGAIVIYELDPDRLQCDCHKSAQCDGQLLFSLTPSIPPEILDLSKFSYAISRQVIWEDYMIGAGYAIQQTALNLKPHPTDSIWTVSCSTCPNLAESDEFYLHLHPKKIICGKLLDHNLRAEIHNELSKIAEVSNWK